MPVCVAGAVLCLWVSACAALWACALGVAVGVCVPVVRFGALSVCCVAGFALCAAVGVCAVVCAYALCPIVLGCVLSIKTRVYSDFRMQWIICGLYWHYVRIILYIISPPALEDNRDNVDVFFRLKKRTPHQFGSTPP